MNVPSLIFAAAVVLLHVSSVCASCRKLVQEDWSELVFFLDEAQALGFVMLCPFKIKGSKCPHPNTDGYVISAFMVDIYCAYWWGGSDDGCEIDCDMKKNHFIIDQGAIVTMDGLSLKGAREHSIWVKPFAYFKSIAGSFENNGYVGNEGNLATTKSIGGAAVFVDEYAFAELDQCKFLRNQGQQGGAILNYGEVIMSGGNLEFNLGEQGGAIFSTGTTTVNQAFFRDNQAHQSPQGSGGDGGAIYTTSALIMSGNTFQENTAEGDGGALCALGAAQKRCSFCIWKQNRAENMGPAIYGGGTFNDNEGCGNNSPATIALANSNALASADSNGIANSNALASASCNGVADTNGDCDEFPSVCALPPSEAPTPSPTSSAQPSSSPTTTQTPSEYPSHSPSHSPSLRPSVSPSQRPSYSFSPSNSPSASPSKSPSATPSSSPSVLPTASPSKSPSATPSSSPSVLPTASPSKSPSGPPTTAPSQSPSKILKRR